MEQCQKPCQQESFAHNYCNETIVSTFLPINAKSEFIKLKCYQLSLSGLYIHFTEMDNLNLFGNNSLVRKVGIIPLLNFLVDMTLSVYLLL